MYFILSAIYFASQVFVFIEKEVILSSLQYMHDLLLSSDDPTLITTGVQGLQCYALPAYIMQSNVRNWTAVTGVQGLQCYALSAYIMQTNVRNWTAVTGVQGLQCYALSAYIMQTNVRYWTAVNNGILATKHIAWCAP